MTQQPALWVIGTFDTKAQELLYLARLVRQAGIPVLTVDIGTRSNDSPADLSADHVAAYHTQGADYVLGGSDRGQAVIAMGQALRNLVSERLAGGAILGVLGIGGSGGTSMISPALHVLPYGMPKMLVSTLAAGTVTPFVDIYDIIVVNPVTDLAGLNRLSRQILANAAHAMVGMLSNPVAVAGNDDRPTLGLTMFGVTTPCVQAVSRAFDADYDCQVFHANGLGGRTLEALADAGMFKAVLDITTTEVGQNLAGGVCDAGPDRLNAAAKRGIPWVGSVGALDMINWGPPETIPPQFFGRRFHVHNAHVTLMRTTADELTRVGLRIAEKLNQSPGPVHLFLPLHGLSAIDAPGQPFHDPAANRALFDAIESAFVPTEKHHLHTVPLHINDPDFATLLVQAVKAL
ncbi:MAG: Tm-1-like ATP-binding domain-containing protein [Burkholderiaceae bacterium]